MADFTLTTRNEGNVVIIETSGYLNNVGGEKIAEVCYQKLIMEKNILINLDNSKVVNTWCIILIEIIEKLQDVKPSVITTLLQLLKKRLT